MEKEDRTKISIVEGAFEWSDVKGVLGPPNQIRKVGLLSNAGNNDNTLKNNGFYIRK